MTDKTRKDRQSRARERVKLAGGHRITVAISAEALEVLRNLCATLGISQGQAVSYVLTDRLQWLPNPGHEPEIPEGWEFAGLRFLEWDQRIFPSAESVKNWGWGGPEYEPITEYAIRRKLEPIR